MTTLVIAEHNNNILAEHTGKTVSAAKALGSDIHVLVAGHNCTDVTTSAAILAGVTKVITADSDALAHQFAEPMAKLILSLADTYETILAPATASGKNILPRVAAKLDIAQISDIIEIVSPDTFKRPIYAGNAIQTVQTSDAKKIITVRTTAFPSTETGEPAPIENIEFSLEKILARFINENLASAERPDLATAKIVVSGGRAFASKESFDNLLNPLADKLGAAIGASRAAVDAGYASNDLQVGQTGQIVAPDLYIACGISGAIQHIAGMNQSKTIVAINSDANAPIFQIADYGLVGDLFEILPELTNAL